MNTTNGIFGVDSQGNEVDVLEELKNSLKANGSYPQLTAGALSGKNVVTDQTVSTVSDNTVYIKCSVTAPCTVGNGVCFINCSFTAGKIDISGENISFYNCDMTAGTVFPNASSKSYFYNCKFSSVGNIVQNGEMYLDSCSGALLPSGTTFKLYISRSPDLTFMTGVDTSNWRNIFVNGEASYIALNSVVKITKDTEVNTEICELGTLQGDEEIIFQYRATVTGFSYAGYTFSTNRATSNRTTLYGNVSRRNSAGTLDEKKGAVNLNLANGNTLCTVNMKMFNSPETDDFSFEITNITLKRRLV